MTGEHASSQASEHGERVSYRDNLAEAIYQAHDAALRQAAHTGQPIDVDMAELIRDGLADLGIEWEDSDAPDTPPQWLVDAVVGLVRPAVAQAHQATAKLALTVSEVTDAWETDKAAIQRAKATITALRHMAGQPPAEKQEDPSSPQPAEEPGQPIDWHVIARQREREAWRYAENAHRWQQKAADAAAILRDLVDPDECDHFDHHGNCQTHGAGDPCPHARAKEFLAAFRLPIEDDPSFADHDPATLRPGEPPTKVHTIHLPEG